MRVTVVNNCVPFERGGAEYLAETLVRQIGEHGHEAELVRLPFRWDPPSRIVDSMLAASLVQVANCDRVVGLKFPAYYVRHDDKVLWLLHQFRQVYDLWGTDHHELPFTDEVTAIRDAVFEADNRCFSECRAIYANSPVTRQRLARYNGFDSTVLWPPLADVGAFRCTGYGDYVVALGRVNGAKRQAAAVEAMRFVRSPVRLVVAGPPESEADADELRRLVAEHDLGDRVTLDLRFVTEDEKVELLAGALACVYLPYQEDSYGYVTLESFAARKPVVTTDDSGGILLLVDDGRTGLVCAPDPGSLAGCFDRLHRDRALARRLGEAGLRRALDLGITWETVVGELTS